MLGDEAREFLKRLYKLDRIWKDDGESEYSERQLVQFAERYHEHKLKKWNGNVEICDECGFKWKKYK